RGQIFGGGRRARGVYDGTPAWLPTTAWQWASITGTRWTDYIKDNGTGLAPQVTANDPGVSKTYGAVWDYSGPCYSKARHEFWMFGGGHAGTTINILTRWNLNTDSPSVSMMCAPSSESVRRTQALDNYTTYIANGPCFSDGKPYSPHSYYNNLYLDGVDQFMSFVIDGIATSADGSTMGGVTASFYTIAAFGRNDSTWLPANTYTDVVSSPAGANRGPRPISADGLSVYYWADSGGLRKWHQPTDTHSVIGGTGTKPPNPGPCCNNGSDVSLHIERDSTAGWNVKTCDLSTGTQTTVTVGGYSIGTGLQCYGVEYVSATDTYITVWVDSTSYNGTASITSILVVELELTSASAATATLKTMTGTAPTKCGSYCGMGYDPTFGVVLLAMDETTPIHCFKVA
ncbi:MAG: hypothetical protein RL375_2530, partial [Pseudomonadota bacterium]